MEKLVQVTMDRACPQGKGMEREEKLLMGSCQRSLRIASHRLGDTTHTEGKIVTVTISPSLGIEVVPLPGGHPCVIITVTLRLFVDIRGLREITMWLPTFAIQV